MIEINWKNNISDIIYQLQTDILPIDENLYHYFIEHIVIFKEYDWRKT